ncbi:putative tyrosine-protein phosphatase F54C8.4 [Dirofilaria immitis]
MGRTSRVVPKQWLRYEPIGLPIPNTRFLVFKTPLSMTLSTKIPKEKRFTTLNLLQKLGEKGIQVGLIIDLTDTDRYYERTDIERMCILYEKINCPGRGFIERDDLVDAFNAIVDNFLESNVDNDIMIGVHCTNGVNRSGYLICRFLIDRLGWSSHDAIDAFERTRGYPIERGSYVQALHRAAKERRSKKRHKHTDEVISSDESEIQKMLKKRIKHKKRRKNENGSGDENCTPDMEAVLNQMAIAFEQHQSSLNSLSDASINFGMEVTTGSAEIQQQSQTSSHISAENSPFIGSTGTGEEEEDDDLSGEQDVQTMSTEPEIEISKSKKRRERRLRLQKQFELMKTGNFWKINEMQKEKFGTL